MMMKNLSILTLLYLFLFLCLCFSSCNRKDPKEGTSEKAAEVKVENKNSSDLFSIDIEKAVEEAKPGKLAFSSLGKTIEFIPLETTSASLFGGGRHGIEVQLVSNKTILIDMKRFDRRTGRFLGKLMEKGGGPQEYYWILSYAADDEREEYFLYDLSKMQIHIVGYDGTYKKHIPCGDGLRIYNLGNGNLVLAEGESLADSYDDFSVINVDTGEKVLKRRSSALSNIKSLNECNNIYQSSKGGYWKLGRNVFWQYEDKIRYYDCLTDSVYTLHKDLKIEPAGTFRLGNLRLTKEQGKVGLMSRSFFTWRISNVIETPDQMVVFVSATKTKPAQEGKYYQIVYSKKDKTIHTNQYPGTGYSYENDVDETVAFYLREVQNDLSWFGLVPVEEIKERAGKPFSANGTAFRQMAAQLKDDDNEVLAILK